MITLMKILTLNAWGTHGPPVRREILLSALQALNPEIACLQEVTDRALLETLPFQTCFYAKDSGLAIVSRFPAVTHRVITYSAVSPLEPYRRQALLAKLETGSVPLWVATTHLAWKAEDEATRAAQVEELLQQVEPLRPWVLLGGDFNASPESTPIQRIRASGFSDLFAAVHPDDPGITWDNRNPFIQSHSVQFPDRRIDYLFLPQEAFSRLAPIQCEVVCQTPNAQGLYPSDHYGVLAAFK